MTAGERRILIASVYIPCVHAVGILPSQSQEQMCQSIRRLDSIIESERVTYPDTDIVVAGEFNRHDMLWGGPAIGETNRQGEAEPIVNFIEQQGLQSLLLPGEITYETAGFRSTIDLSLASHNLASNLIKCEL